MAHEFADLHDRAGRMEAKGVIRKALEWKNSRRFFHGRLVRRLTEERIRNQFKVADSALDMDAITAELQVGLRLLSPLGLGIKGGRSPTEYSLGHKVSRFASYRSTQHPLP